MSRMVLLALAVCISTTLARSAGAEATGIMPLAAKPASPDAFDRDIPITPDTATQSPFQAGLRDAGEDGAILLVIKTMPAHGPSATAELCLEGYGQSLAPTLADQADARYVSIFCRLKVAVSMICRANAHLMQVDMATTEVFPSRGSALPFDLGPGDPSGSYDLAVLATLGMGR